MTIINILPKVSIILPTYNRQQYIMEAIKSVCRQSYTNWELLVIDDQSTDNTAGMVKSIKDERVLLFQTKKRLGITGTRNEGLRKATGELIAFIDSDDLWAADKLEKQVAIFNKYPDAAFGLTGGYDFRNLHEPVKFSYKQRTGSRYGDLLIPFFKSEIAATTPSLIFRKECLTTTGFFDESKPFADIDFILRLAEHTKGIVLYEPLFYRRLHDSNISNSEWEKGCEEGVQLALAYQKKLPVGIAKNALFRTYINFGERSLSHKKRKKAIGKFLQAWKAKPFSIVPAKKIAKAILHY